MRAAAVEAPEMRSRASAQAADAPARLRRLGGFLRCLTAGLLVETVVELLLLGHYKDPIQLLPFALCLLGLGALGLLWRRSDRLAVLAFRVTMAALALGSLVGAAEHAAGNLEDVEQRDQARRRASGRSQAWRLARMVHLHPQGKDGGQRIRPTD